MILIFESISLKSLFFINKKLTNFKSKILKFVQDFQSCSEKASKDKSFSINLNLLLIKFPFSTGDVIDILTLINSAINFILYCTMSRQFRMTFNQLFCSRWRLIGRWMAVPHQPMENNGHTGTNHTVTQVTQVQRRRNQRTFCYPV